MAFTTDKALDNTWQDAYTLSGITPYSPLTIQNKNSHAVLVHVGPSAPTETNTGVAVFLHQYKYFTCAVGESIFVKGVGQCSIQEGFIQETGLQIVDSSTGSLRPATTADFANGWSTTAYTLNADGDIISETQSNGTSTRTRSWSYSTDGSGNTTATAGSWS